MEKTKRIARNCVPTKINILVFACAFLFILVTATDTLRAARIEGAGSFTAIAGLYIYRYQTIFAGIAALSAAFYASIPVYKQLSEIEFQNLISRHNAISADNHSFRKLIDNIIVNINTNTFTSFARYFQKVSYEGVPADIDERLARFSQEMTIVMNALFDIGANYTETLNEYKAVYRARRICHKVLQSVNDVTDAIEELRRSDNYQYSDNRENVIKHIDRAHALEAELADAADKVMIALKYMNRRRSREVHVSRRAIIEKRHAATSASAATSNSVPPP